jgi:iron complex outermembrane recepter protein
MPGSSRKSTTFIVAMLAAIAAPIALSQTAFKVDIPPQNLADALRAVGRQTSTNIIFEPAIVKGFKVAQVSAQLTADQAIQKLLDGTQLTARRTSTDTIVIREERAKTEGRETGNATEAQKSSLWDRFRLARADDANAAQNAAAAQGEASELQQLMLEEIVVTATKRLESVRDIPMSIAVIGNQDIERRGLIGMEDYLRSIPGTNQIDNGPRSNAIVIRGISTSPEFENASSGSGATVASYFDETPITAAGGVGAGGIDVRPVDIERIEVLRGPQGTTYGSASLGGAMRIIPVKPKLDAFSTRVAASYSDTSGNGGGNSMIQGIVNLPVVKDVLALRAVGYRYEDSGFYKNVAGSDPATIAAATAFGLGNYVSGFVQDDVGHMVSSGGRLAALWRPTDNLDLTMNFLTQTIEQDGQPLAESGQYDQKRIPVAPAGRVRGESGEVSDTEMDLVNLVVNYDLGWAKLTSAGSWIDSNSFASATSIGPPFPLSTSSPSDFRSRTIETRLASQLAGRFQFLGGLFFEDIDEAYVQTVDWPGTPATSPVGTNPMALIDIQRELDQRAVFGEVSYDLTQNLTATVGGRYFKYKKSQRDLREGGFFGRPIGAGVPANLANDEDGSTFKAGLDYKLRKNALLYASWSEGFRLGRPAPGLPPTCDPDGDGFLNGTNISIASTRQIDSDFLENYEIGGKFALFDSRLTLDTSVYHIKWDGLPVRSAALFCSSAFTANAGAAESDGVELQASLLVRDGLRVDFGGGYTDARLTKDALGLLPPAFKDDRLPGTPRVNANLAAQYDFDLAGHRVFVRADSLYVGSFYGDLQTSPGSKAGDYVKIDARAGMAFNALSLELFVRNLTDEDAFTWRGLTANATNPFFGYRLRPRTYGVQVAYSFE